jgi:hypothetical protein
MQRVYFHKLLDDEIALNDDISVYFEEKQNFGVLILIFALLVVHVLLIDQDIHNQML